MDTPCKNCCFAIYAENTQIDCEAGVLDKLHDKNVDITCAYDHQKEFFVVPIFCPYFRNNNIEVQPVWKYSDSSDRLAQVNKELTIQISAVLYLDKDNTENDLKDSFSQLNNLTILPCELIIINNGCKMRPSTIRRVCQGNFPYKIEITVEELSKEDCLNIASVKSCATYISWFNCGQQIEKNLFEKLDQKIKNLEPFLVYRGNPDWHGLTIQKTLFDLLGRNTGKSFLEKFQNIPEHEKFLYDDKS